MARAKFGYRLNTEPGSTWTTVTAAPSLRETMPYVQEIGEGIARSSFYARRDALSSYFIQYTVDGEGIVEYGDQSYTLRPGHVFWTDCAGTQRYYTSPNFKKWHILWVHFHGPVCCSYYDLFLSQNDGGHTTPLPPSSELEAHMRELNELYSQGERGLLADIRAAGLLTHIMVQCCGSTLENQMQSGLPDCVTAARTYLTDHYNERITLDDLAERYSINKYYFQKLFKKHTGFTPNEFLILSRLDRAKELLRTTAMPISAVAAQVGVDNVSHFINLFKKHEHITPNIYRQNWFD